MTTSKLCIRAGVFLMALFIIALTYGIKLQMASASESGSRDNVTRSLAGADFSESSPNNNAMKTIASQQNYCQGNNVICQNIFTVCVEGAVCIIGNMDPFLLVLPY
ncbi:MAG TPA: hypothetical protein VE130_02485 [Nitrososphaeraceae archaeon]|nr:hypothetical protein [Nitrososphaeraceae archaeon]